MVSSFARAILVDADAAALPDEAASDATPDRAALSAAYPTLAPRVHRFLSDLLRDPTLAADATQLTFVRAFRRIEDVASGTRLAPWVFGIARKVSLETRRTRTRARRLVDDRAPQVPDVPDDARSPEATFLAREALSVVSTALDSLSDDRRAVLLLRLDHGLAYEDIAELMGWSLAKVKVELFRGREVLRTTLEDYQRGGT
jgi:RNA polymerase sigma-70 factor (ECF subfamily)